MKLERWPRIASQRMKRRAHLFEGGHNERITALTGDSTKILTAGQMVASLPGLLHPVIKCILWKASQTLSLVFV
jgi:hypothetical protein